MSKEELMYQILNGLENKIPTLNVAIDTGKAFTKYYHKKLVDGKLQGITDKFPSAIGKACDDEMGANTALPFSTNIPGKDIPYYIDDPALCNIATTDDNEKNGMGRLSGKDSNHDGEISTLCACLAICKVMDANNTRTADVNVALGMPISEFFKHPDKDSQQKYFETILPIDKTIMCSKNGETYSFTIRKNAVCSETYAAFINSNGNENRNCIVVDIGGNNIQFICFTDGRVITDDYKTTTVKGGANKLVRMIIDAMNVAQFDPYFYKPAMIMSWLSDPSKITLAKDDAKLFNEIVSKNKETYFNSIINDYFNTASGKYANEIRRGHKIAFIGGGSVLLKDRITKVKNAIILGGGEYANVKGFYDCL